ncbi:unnamed protein product [Acanthoscelides obtectus]|uniref:Uncharacterized protein n=1 Tax=Acanthoscelides obtectus TaxID=200917 RepID=A0A9P0M6W1_ACAOB|nr:unnamed protein product [Acanthoscelides obtectus]CAK1642119.1 hypothetical protein AOBTE_LOCUS12840 [Acanthoscelides obtectus]
MRMYRVITGMTKNSYNARDLSTVSLDVSTKRCQYRARIPKAHSITAQEIDDVTEIEGNSEIEGETSATDQETPTVSNNSKGIFVEYEKNFGRFSIEVGGFTAGTIAMLTSGLDLDLTASRY